MRLAKILIVFLQSLTLLHLCVAIYRINRGSTAVNIDITGGEKCSTKILVIIPAHNEETLIRRTIMAIKNSRYPDKLRDIVLLADRCTDNTVNIAREENIVVYENLRNINCTKSGILKAFFEQHINIINRYDYVCFIDGDTLVNEYFFVVADREFKKGHKIVQGKVNVINTTKNFVSGFMAIYQSIINIFFFEYQNCNNHSVLIAGKGMFISPSVFNYITWNEKSLIEDVDFSFQAACLDIPIFYCDKIKVASIQPYTLQDMWNQQRRWLSGQNQIIKDYFGQLVKGTLNGGAKAFVIEGIISICILPLILISIFSEFIGLILLYYIIAVVVATIVVKVDNSQEQITTMDIYVFPMILLYWYIINVISFFKPITIWKNLKYKSHQQKQYHNKSITNYI